MGDATMPTIIIAVCNPQTTIIVYCPGRVAQSGTIDIWPCLVAPYNHTSININFDDGAQIQLGDPNEIVSHSGAFQIQLISSVCADIDHDSVIVVKVIIVGVHMPWKMDAPVGGKLQAT